MKYVTGFLVFFFLVVFDSLEVAFFFVGPMLDDNWPHSPEFAKKLWLN